MPHPDSTPRLPRAAPPSPAAPAPRAPADSEDARGQAPGNAVPEEDIEPADATADYPHPAQAGRAANAPWLRRMREIDAARPGFPGEHLAVLGLGVWLMRRGMRGGTPLRRMLLTLAGTTLVGRAASGTGGIARVARVLRRLG